MRVVYGILALLLVIVAAVLLAPTMPWVYGLMAGWPSFLQQGLFLLYAILACTPFAVLVSLLLIKAID